MTDTRVAYAAVALLFVLALLFLVAAAVTLGSNEDVQHQKPAGEIGSGITHVLPGGKR